MSRQQRRKFSVSTGYTQFNELQIFINLQTILAYFSSRYLQFGESEHYSRTRGVEFAASLHCAPHYTWISKRLIPSQQSAARPWVILHLPHCSACSLSQPKTIVIRHVTASRVLWRLMCVVVVICYKISKNLQLSKYIWLEINGIVCYELVCSVYIVACLTQFVNMSSCVVCVTRVYSICGGLCLLL
jgi:hypothetical protein